MKLFMLFLLFFIFVSCVNKNNSGKSEDAETIIAAPENQMADAELNTPEKDNADGMSDNEDEPERAIDKISFNDEGVFTDDKYSGYAEDEIIEKVFTNKISGEKIYYTGPDRGEGDFWVYHNNKKAVILNEYVKYGPMIIWWGGNIAEIFLPTGSPFRHSYFYNFRNNRLSEAYGFTVYVDPDKEYAIEWRDGGLDVYDLKDDSLIKQYEFDGDITTPYPYGDYDIIIKNNKLVFLYYGDFIYSKGEWTRGNILEKVKEYDY